MKTNRAPPVRPDKFAYREWTFRIARPVRLNVLQVLPSMMSCGVPVYFTAAISAVTTRQAVTRRLDAVISCQMGLSRDRTARAENQVIVVVIGTRIEIRTTQNQRRNLKEERYRLAVRTIGNRRVNCQSFPLSGRHCQRPVNL